MLSNIAMTGVTKMFGISSILLFIIKLRFPASETVPQTIFKRYGPDRVNMEKYIEGEPRPENHYYDIHTFLLHFSLYLKHHKYMFETYNNFHQ